MKPEPSFTDWYDPRFGQMSKLTRYVLWTVGCGFVWIPFYFCLWRGEQIGKISPAVAWAWRLGLPLLFWFAWRKNSRQAELAEQARFIAEELAKKLRQG
jgi:hypothetical protein